MSSNEDRLIVIEELDALSLRFIIFHTFRTWRNKRIFLKIEFRLKMFIELGLSIFLVSRDMKTSKMCSCPKGRQ